MKIEREEREGRGGEERVNRRKRRRGRIGENMRASSDMRREESDR